MTILLLLAGFAVLPDEPLPAEVPEMSASELIKKCETAYAEVKTYVGTTTARIKAEHGATKVEYLSKAKITFMRPGKLFIEGQTMSRDFDGQGGHPFTIVSDGTKTWHRWPLYNQGEFREVKSLAAAGMAGVAQRTADGIPAALMKGDGSQFGEMDPFYVARLSEAKIDGMEKIDGAPCYKVVANRPEIGNVTLWIDAKYFLLRQMTWELSEARLAWAAKKADEGLKKMGQQRQVPHTTAKVDLLKFDIYQVDSRVDEKLFADPTVK